MDNRLPAYFQLSRYSITPQAVVKTVLHCDPDSIQTKAIVTPAWDVDVFATHLESMSEISKGVVYQWEYHGQLISFIRSGIGAPMTGDVTPLNKSLFSGRSKREMERRHLIKRTVLAKAVLNSVIDDIT